MLSFFINFIHLKDNYIKPSTSMSENNVTSVSSPIRKQFGAINDMQGSLKQQFLYNPDVLQNVCFCYFALQDVHFRRYYQLCILVSAIRCRIKAFYDNPTAYKSHWRN